MQTIKRQYSNIGNTNAGNTSARNTSARNTNSGNTKRSAFNAQKIISTPVKQIRRNSLLIVPQTPHKLKREKSIIVEHPDIKLLKELIIVLVKKLNLSNKTNLNNWLKIYKEKANNNSSNPTKEQHIQIFSVKDLNLNSLRVLKERNTVFSGAHANVYTSIKNKNGKSLDIVIKQFKQETNNNRIDTTLLAELYGALLNLYIQTNLTIKEQNFFNRIIGLYLFKKFIKISTLQLVLEKCNGGDLITYFGNPFLATLDINSKCNIFHKLCYDGLVMLFLLVKLELVHLDIKIDNILVHTKNDKIQFKLADYSTTRPYGTQLTSKCGTNSYMPPKLLLDLESDNAKAKYLDDFYSMALTFYNISLFLFPSNVNTSQYFPFTNDVSTFKSKIDIWSNQKKYNDQVRLLQSSLKYCLESVSIIPELTKENRDIFFKDLQMIQTLLLSNNPFPNPGQNIEAETIQKIEEYLR